MKESEKFFFYGLYYYAQGHRAKVHSVQMNWSQRSFYQCRGLMERGLHEAVRRNVEHTCCSLFIEHECEIPLSPIYQR